MQDERDIIGDLIYRDPYAALMELRARAMNYAEDPEVRHEAQIVLRIFEGATGCDAGLMPSDPIH